MSGKPESGVESREAGEDDIIVYLQSRTCNAIEAMHRAFLAAGKQVRSLAGGGVSLAAVRAMERAVVDLNRELQVDLQRAQLDALAAADVAELRWMATRDIDTVLALEAICLTAPLLTREQYFPLLDRFDTLAIVAEIEQHLAGYCLLQLWRGEVVCVNVCVAPEYRRRGIGRQLIRRAIAKLTRRRQFVTCSVHENNVLAQQFLKGCGFRYRSKEEGGFATGGEPGDIYSFEYRLNVVAADSPAGSETRGDA